MHTIDTFIKETLLVSGKLLKAQITVSYDYDQEPVDGTFDFGNEADNTAYIKRFDSGELLSVNVNVEAKALREVGNDSLCACHVKSSSFVNDIMQDVVVYHSMIENAVEDLVKKILKKHADLTEFLEPTKIKGGK